MGTELAEPEADPLDAFMDEISKDAVVQEAVTVEQITEREMQQQLLVQEGEEVFDSDSEEIKPSNNVITLEDILGGAEPPTTDD